MDLFELENQKSKIVQPLLLPMVDIFSMLILFLIAGTIFGASVIMPGMSLAKGHRNDVPQIAQQIYINHDTVSFSFANEKYPITLFLKENITDPRLAQIKRKLSEILRTQVAAIDPQAFYIVADKAVSYRLIFDLVSFFNENGVKTFLFVSEVSAK